MADVQSPANANVLKRKRSSPGLTSPVVQPQNKIQKTNNVQINYLARQSSQDLPLINKNETLPSILDVLSSYSAVLDRHESLAGNLGARPLGPILIKRFERCFDGSPEVIASHSHNGHSAESLHITWLEVIQFAQSHPGQFTLSAFSEGRRVCQFYYPQKQVRLQISEEDYLFIKSGRCQDLIPPLPIWEDEEKEVGTCEILEKQLRDLTSAADTVAARTRQLSHRLKSRRMAILERRAGETDNDNVHEASSSNSLTRRSSSSNVNGHSASGLGFTNGTTGEPGAGSSVRNELLMHFQSLSQNQPSERARRQSLSVTSPRGQQTGPAYPFPNELDHHDQQRPHGPSVSSNRPDPLSYHLAESYPPPPASTSRPSSTHTPTHGKHNFSRPLAPGQEVSQPFRTMCQALMESLPRGARVVPPCDRCRRLKMDCLKNLTSCLGCTKKHARCHWKDVERSEVNGLEDVLARAQAMQRARGSGDEEEDDDDEDDDDEEGIAALEDLEALDRETDEDRPATSEQPSPPLASGGELHPLFPIAEDKNIPASADASPSTAQAPPPSRPSAAFSALPGFTSVNNLPRALTNSSPGPAGVNPLLTPSEAVKAEPERRDEHHPEQEATLKDTPTLTSDTRDETSQVGKRDDRRTSPIAEQRVEQDSSRNITSLPSQHGEKDSSIPRTERNGETFSTSGVRDAVPVAFPAHQGVAVGGGRGEGVSTGWRAV